MSHHHSFITFSDLSPEGRFLWLSPSVYDVLGYTPDELLGIVPFDLINTEDIAHGRVGLEEGVLNDLIASQITFRFIAKDGHLVPCVSVYSLCYDMIVSCVTMVHSNLGTYRQLRSHSALMNQLVGSKKQEFERIKRHHEAFTANRWDIHGMEPEPRVCMILNCFSRSLIIMYASSACERIFHIDPDHIVGKPILLFIRADDLASFVEQMDMVKAAAAITHIRFWFQSPRLRWEVPCEAMLFGATDGIVAVMRRCRPFVRKRFIESRHYNQTAVAAAAATANINKNRSQSSSWTSASSASPSSVSSAASCLSMSRIRGIRIVDLDRNSYGNNSNDEIDNNISNSSSNNNNKNSSAHTTRRKTRPLALPTDDPLLVKDGVDLIERFGLKVYNVQDYVEEQDGDEDSGDDIDDHGADMNMDLDIR